MRFRAVKRFTDVAAKHTFGCQIFFQHTQTVLVFVLWSSVKLFICIAISVYNQLCPHFFLSNAKMVSLSKADQIVTRVHRLSSNSGKMKTYQMYFNSNKMLLTFLSFYVCVHSVLLIIFPCRAWWAQRCCFTSYLFSFFLVKKNPYFASMLKYFS